MMRNTFVKAALAAGALLLAALPASAQGFGYGSRDGYGGYSGSYSDYGRGYSNPYQNGYGSQHYNSYGNSYGDSYGYGGYMRRHHRDWNDRRWHRDWSHQDRYWD